MKQLNQKAQAAIDSANRYTDGKIIDTKNELNTNINNAKDEAINTSNSYTNKKHEESLNHTKEVAGQAEKNELCSFLVYGVSGRVAYPAVSC